MSHPGSQAMYCRASYTYKSWGRCWPTDWALSAYSAVSSAVQITKVQQGSIRTTEKIYARFARTHPHYAPLCSTCGCGHTTLKLLPTALPLCSFLYM